MSLLAASAPTAPRSPTATPANGSVKLTWLSPSSNGGAAIDGYQVQRASSGGPWTTIASPTGTSYTAVGLTNGTKYDFRIRAHNSAGYGPFSTVVSAVPRTVPSAPMYPSATPGNASMHVTWKKPASSGGATVDRYAVQRATSLIGPWTTIATPTTLEYWATGLTNGTTYFFRVVAHNAAGWGKPSNVVADIPRNVPTAPGQLKVTSTTYTSVSLTWAPAGTNGAPIDGYELWRSTESTPWIAVGSTLGTSMTSYDLQPGTEYRFRVRAHNAAGWSDWSWTVSISTKDLTQPDAPAWCTATQSYGPGWDTAYIDWSAPTSNGGSPILDYHIFVSGGGNYANVIRSVDTAGPFTDLYLHLPLGSVPGSGWYKVEVLARNAIGYSARCVTYVLMNP